MIEALLVTFFGMRILFLAACGLVVLPLHYVLRMEWNRAGMIAGLSCALAFGALQMVPTKTMVVRLDMPRPR